MAKVGYYAVRKGKNPGIYSTWAECEANVKGFSGAEYKKFSSEDEANAFMNENTAEAKVQPEIKAEAKPEPVAASSSTYHPRHVNVFVDGSYNSDTNKYGYGVYMDDGKNQHIYVGNGVCEDGGRNVEGEVAASRVALWNIAKSGKYDSVTLYHDYQGIGSWADHDWKANKGYTKAYANFVDRIRNEGLDIKFVHVDGHTGVEGNEYVDKLAKMGCGVPLTQSEKTFIEKLRNVPGYPSDNRSIDRVEEMNFDQPDFG